MIDYTRSTIGETTTDDVLEFARFVETRSGGKIKLSPEAAEDCIILIGSVAAKDALNRRQPLGVSDPNLARLGRAQAAHEAAANITLSVARSLTGSLCLSEDREERLRSISKLVVSDNPPSDILYAVRRVVLNEDFSS